MRYVNGEERTPTSFHEVAVELRALRVRLDRLERVVLGAVIGSELLGWLAGVLW